MAKILDDRWEITLPDPCANPPKGPEEAHGTWVPGKKEITVTFNDKPSTVEAWMWEWKKRIEEAAKENLEGFYRLFEPMDLDNISELGFKLRKPVEKLTPEEKGEIRNILKSLFKNADYYIYILDHIMKAAQKK